MNQISKILILTGFLIILIGILLNFSNKFFNLGKLPGDIIIDKKNFKFYFPITTSIIISLVLSLLLWLFFYLKK